jgi:ADP-heptose:LPS heptosyltransferase
VTDSTILVIHPGALGDVLQALPAIHELRRGGVVTFSGQPRLAKLFLEMGLVDAVLPFDGLGLEALFTRARPPADLVARLSSFARMISWFGSRDEDYGRQLRAIAKDCVIAPPVPAEGSRASVWRHLLTTIGASGSPDIAPIDVPEMWLTAGDRALTDLGATPTRPLLVVHPGAGGRWKLWPVEHYARVIRGVTQKTEVEVLLHQGPSDREIAESLCGALDATTLRLVDPELSLLAAILARSSAYFGVDSGVSHLAAAVGARAVVLFPPATRDRWEPWSQNARALTMSGEVDQIDGVTSALIERVREGKRERIGRR